MKARVKDVKIGDTSLGDLIVLVGEMKSDKAKGLYPDADGMIAYTAFRNYVLTLDFRDKTISVSSRRIMESHGSVGKLSHPTFANTDRRLSPPLASL